MYPPEAFPKNFYNLYVPSKICQKPHEPSPWIFKPCASMNCHSPPVQIWSEVVCHVPDSGTVERSTIVSSTIIMSWFDHARIGRFLVPT